VDSVDMDGAVARIDQWMRQRRAGHVVTLGAEMASLAQRDESYREAINGADLIVPDTIGIVWASRVLGQPLRERVSGIDLVERLLALQHAPRLRVFVLGAAAGVADDAAQALAIRYQDIAIVGMHHGYFDEDHDADVARLVRSADAQLVLVALGFPRQEYWIRDRLAEIGPAVCIGVGGAVDVWAGQAMRAPLMWRRLGLEWLYRLVREPKRFRRQLALPRFAALVFAQAMRGRAAKPWT
jgi:N-acetylglucosaminyldiphosphoundecaprenol N-acetyl-beta-D-mannosaminyltransferase